MDSLAQHLLSRLHNHNFNATAKDTDYLNHWFSKELEALLHVVHAHLPTLEALQREFISLHTVEILQQLAGPFFEQTKEPDMVSDNTLKLYFPWLDLFNRKTVLNNLQQREKNELFLELMREHEEQVVFDSLFQSDPDLTLVKNYLDCHEVSAYHLNRIAKNLNENHKDISLLIENWPRATEHRPIFPLEIRDYAAPHAQFVKWVDMNLDYAQHSPSFQHEKIEYFFSYFNYRDLNSLAHELLLRCYVINDLQGKEPCSDLVFNFNHALKQDYFKKLLPCDVSNNGMSRLIHFMEEQDIFNTGFFTQFEKRTALQPEEFLDSAKKIIAQAELNYTLTHTLEEKNILSKRLKI